MIWHEIVKYSSENYGENGVYTKDEWTSRSDIGTVYEGKTFGLEKFQLSARRVTWCCFLSIKNANIAKLFISDAHYSHLPIFRKS